MERYHPNVGALYPPKSASDPTLHLYSELTYQPRVEVRFWKGTNEVFPLPGFISEAASKICQRLEDRVTHGRVSDGVKVTSSEVPASGHTLVDKHTGSVSDSQVYVKTASQGFDEQRSRFGLFRCFRRRKNRSEADKLAVRNYKEKRNKKNKKMKKSKDKFDTIEDETPVEILNDAIHRAMFPILCRTQGMEFDQEYYDMFKMSVREIPQMESIYEIEEMDNEEVIEVVDPKPEEVASGETDSRLRRFRKMAAGLFRRMFRNNRA